MVSARSAVLAVLVCVAVAAGMTPLLQALEPRSYNLETGAHRTLKLRAGDVDVRAAAWFHSDAEAMTVREADASFGHSGHAQYIVTLKAATFAHGRRAVESILGRELTRYLPHNSYIFVAREADVAAIAQLDTVVWVGLHKASYRRTEKTVRALSARAVSTEPALLSVSLAPELKLASSPVDLASAHAGITAALTRAGITASVRASAGSRFALVEVAGDSSRAAMDALLAHPLVAWVEERAVMRKLNQYAKAVVQNYADSAAATNFAAAGLTGSGQIVGVADTGLDMSSCYFSDPSVTTPYGTTAAAANTAHRKVVLYMPATSGDVYRTDYAGGHGTHVAGSVAGKSNSGTPAGSSGFDAAAADAKMVFFDFGDAAGNLFSFADMATDVLEPAYTVGARVHSNSWGSDTNGAWGDTDVQTDTFVHENPDMLVLFAAGNSGENGWGSVGSPATFKNGLGVGAQTNSYESNEQAYAATYVSIVSGSVSLQNVYRNGPLGGHSAAAQTATIKDMGTACTSLPGASGTIALVRVLEDCNPLAQVEAAVTANVAALVFIAGGVGTVDGTLVINPAFSILVVTTSIGATLAGRDGQSATITGMSIDYSSDLAEGKSSMACFSSRGMTEDYRIQPLVVAPGSAVMSAYSNGADTTAVCDVFPQSGTSMATPTLASHVALMRQYLISGFYPSGVAVPANAIAAPSAALLKALLVNSAQPLTGTVEQACGSGSAEIIPDLNQWQQRQSTGFGRVQLDKTLYLPGSTRTLWLQDEATSAVVSTGTVLNYCFAVRAGEKAVFTLAWTDPPADVSSALYLVNDLDLIVTYGSSVALGNQIAATSGTTASPVALADGANNLEQVTLASTVSGTVTVTVVGVNVPVSAQKFALVFSGAGNYSVGTTCAPLCPAACSAHGTCTNGICACASGFAGADCATAVTPVTLGGSIVSGSVGLGGWVFYSVVPTTDTLGLVVTIDDIAGNPNWFGIAGTGNYPTFGWYTDYSIVTAQSAAEERRSSATFYVDKTNIIVGEPYVFAVYGDEATLYTTSTSASLSSYSFSVVAGDRPPSHAVRGATTVAAMALATVVFVLASLVL